ncbi:hypothetical protein LINPERHAP1_LOCUS37750 [Linum perenne]
MLYLQLLDKPVSSLSIEYPPLVLCEWPQCESCKKLMFCSMAVSPNDSTIMVAEITWYPSYY